MPYDDTYQKAIDKMVVDTNKAIDDMAGWVKHKEPQVMNADDMKRFAFTVNRWNPLFYDEKYAASTRWGGLIAYPMFLLPLLLKVRPVDTPECQVDKLRWIGQDWDFYKPVRPGDTIRVWNHRLQMTERTEPGVKGPRIFTIMSGHCDYINQRDELVATTKNLTQRTYFNKLPEPVNMPYYQFTGEELKYLDRFMHEEEVRGAKTRYWEDVNIGDETRPVVLPPTTYQTNVVSSDSSLRLGSPVPPNELIRDGRFVDIIQDPDTGLYESGAGGAGHHWSDLKARVGGYPGAFLFAVVSAYTMLRLITNFAGDDGFVRRHKWHHLFQTPVGDASIGHGKVINKRVENGEHLVDLEVWMENMCGIVSHGATATVSLLSRETGYPWQ